MVLLFLKHFLKLIDIGLLTNIKAKFSNYHEGHCVLVVILLAAILKDVNLSMHDCHFLNYINTHTHMYLCSNSIIFQPNKMVVITATYSETELQTLHSLVRAGWEKFNQQMNENGKKNAYKLLSIPFKQQKISNSENINGELEIEIESLKHRRHLGIFSKFVMFCLFLEDVVVDPSPYV